MYICMKVCIGMMGVCEVCVGYDNVYSKQTSLGRVSSSPGTDCWPWPSPSPSSSHWGSHCSSLSELYTEEILHIIP